ncbi:hypothetical protein LEP1GSC034_1027 [Leptospira interrogans str. 2003000735]|uniref:Uncharacterized protein n=2 Tax=Leptospira interrogans TaxID=173 RepID=A0A829DCD8_LEPIR|nr:hypothetical protein [Leptospira interrogans]EMY06291.1 hypothetical protein LEP1GSC029_3164 [Leptospira interrogans str. 2002000626]EMY25619.1 hypothetical protein LEP1GSC115_1467 [Leptospira interrogans serovar Australis str. 200703203]EKN89813.1 hypothetical protein LEP1GSC027_3978 [Leptospira interrogans str. 2002000624]EKQ40165.1 hypothetical protein LEP1GSC025_2173 [Leptospira interrogans str. 2002000621]EKQ46019.1 hypothetical protein LEP1GSC026_3171 [Leptospira interrogans str. 2002
MKERERIELLRRKILLAKLYDKDGNRRTPFKIINMLLTRCALQDVFLQDQKLETEFNAWQNEKIITEKLERES